MTTRPVRFDTQRLADVVKPAVSMQTFVLRRDEDETGISGTGIVAEGVMFTDGRCAMRWCTATGPTSTAIYDNVEDLLAIHGHNGKTKLVFVGSVTQ